MEPKDLKVGENYFIQGNVYLLESIRGDEYHFSGVSPLAHQGWYLYPQDGLELVEEFILENK